MASIKFSPLINNIQGSVGGGTIQRNQAGYTLRVKPYSVKEASASQDIRRSWILQIQNAWHALSAQQQSKWIKFNSYVAKAVKRNSDVAMSGYCLFMRHNLLLLNANESILSDLQFLPNNFQDSAGGGFIGAGTLGWDFETAFDSANWVVLLKTTPPLPRELGNYDQYYKVLLYTLIDDFSIDFYSQYLAMFNRLPTAGTITPIKVQFVHKFMPVAQAPFVNISYY